ncbi:hypothetical protein CPLU01_02599 [Colletotrichum plurivorum]|uniref:Uncharacterized protein n=1 Tax=Colletotrichum plurivorum TaxID=2175906 RepID=A0A8H6KW45_9PEZI|nr:hypothetical protein CPLU01_02599 [Colletotrichum plurivorum]
MTSFLGSAVTVDVDGGTGARTLKDFPESDVGGLGRSRLVRASRGEPIDAVGQSAKMEGVSLVDTKMSQPSRRVTKVAKSAEALAASM